MPPRELACGLYHRSRSYMRNANGEHCLAALSARRSGNLKAWRFWQLQLAEKMRALSDPNSTICQIFPGSIWGGGSSFVWCFGCQNGRKKRLTIEHFLTPLWRRFIWHVRYNVERLRRAALLWRRSHQFADGKTRVAEGRGLSRGRLPGPPAATSLSCSVRNVCICESTSVNLLVEYTHEECSPATNYIYAAGTSPAEGDHPGRRRVDSRGYASLAYTGRNRVFRGCASRYRCVSLLLSVPRGQYPPDTQQTCPAGSSTGCLVDIRRICSCVAGYNRSYNIK